MFDTPSQGAPLWPAGHLPHEGGDWMSRLPSPIFDVDDETPRPKLPISPLVGEMSGRTEGGAVEHELLRRRAGASA
ncbi:hypothetical protein EN804_30755 [Mesorhizobium sp. M8A.F.Ca.ET.161.01.1.1]|nr:hypothetical protein EOA36_14280 [Mesorhizobium sp. M8A.F.Ca.ET.021.01.1.1]RUX01639.1 hypothetical protein EOA35_16335 [Mesorhizobium sp. M8A.F.Ca.ET.023.01.1.1]RVD58468.1 hypothetical protein EN746_03295 [Mesorhizobium sp. M8A.F.Ca.ET.023.02.2.1]RWC73345.1 MAG: hypothetical protein EOS71_18410 [Mesorhizobium sp.]TGQ77632.1 hypothetical protein EN850_27690 [Mesorhizobium sp. M8A.F.Ca.ET.207.01.1.1]TGQ90290.1 hypothetical protein EN851_20865 [Mesorhizobium sp. M8A.F.Ca.ET.208.01.1.1]TGT3971